jgi:hypothetical protein
MLLGKSKGKGKRLKTKFVFVQVMLESFIEETRVFQKNILLPVLEM